MIEKSERQKKPREDVFDEGIPSHIINSLTVVFMNLDVFDSNKSLRDFMHNECPNLSPWKYQITEASSPRDRATFLISLLSRAKHAEHGNALLIFLKYLEDKKGCDFSDIWEAVSE